MKRPSIWFALCVGGLALLGGCSSPSTGESQGGTAGKTVKLAFVTNNASDFWTIARKGVEKADGELEDVQESEAL